MSNTRHAQPGAPLRQNRFASSPAIERGLLGNLVALKCATVESAEDRELILWLQGVSWTVGLPGIAAQVLQRHNAATKDLVEVSGPSLEDLQAEVFELRQQLEEIKSRRADNHQSQIVPEDWDAESPLPQTRKTDPSIESAIRSKLSAAFSHLQRMEDAKEMERLPDLLAEFCLNPQIPIADGWPRELPRLCSILRELKADVTDRAESEFAHTVLSRAVWKEILDIHLMGGAALLLGRSGSGNSFSSKACGEVYPGRVRYAVIPATNDATGFWRAIAESVGSAAGQSFKCQQIRDRVIQTLRCGDLVLVLDKCQNLFPVSDYRYALPNRVNWVMELVESGVPVVMLADAKLFDTLGFVEARTGWSRNQFVNQLNLVELPSSLSKEDVQTVAAAVLPDGDTAAQRKLADYMIVAQGYLHSGNPTAQRARRIAAAQNRDHVTLEDMEKALESWGKPAFKSMDAALKRADAAAARCKAKVRNWRPDTEAQITAKGKRRNQIVTSCDVEQTTPSRPARALQDSGSKAADEQFHHRGASPRVGTRPVREVIPADLATV